MARNLHAEKGEKRMLNIEWMNSPKDLINRLSDILYKLTD